jgi:serine/threonine protein kinase
MHDGVTKVVCWCLVIESAVCTVSLQDLYMHQPSVNRLTTPFPRVTMTFTIPWSAHENYVPLKLLGRGKDGIVLLAVPRTGAQDLSTCTALKILEGNSIVTISTELLKQLKDCQDEEDHLLAKVREFQASDNPIWHCMNYVQGFSVEQLLRGKYKDDGMPPTLIFHIIIEIVRAQQHLQKHDKCHIDLKEGGNVMLSANDDSPWPSVTLVDVGGIQKWQDKKVMEHLVSLARKMMGNMNLVPQRWQPGSLTLTQNLLIDGNMFYEQIGKRVKRNENGKLYGFWKAEGERLEKLKNAFQDGPALQSLKSELEGARIIDQDVQSMVDSGGLEVTAEEAWTEQKTDEW